MLNKKFIFLNNCLYLNIDNKGTLRIEFTARLGQETLKNNLCKEWRLVFEFKNWSYMLRTSIDKIKENGFKLTKERSRRYPAQTIIDTDSAGDIVLLANAPAQTKTAT